MHLPQFRLLTETSFNLGERRPGGVLVADIHCPQTVGSSCRRIHWLIGSGGYVSLTTSHFSPPAVVTTRSPRQGFGWEATIEQRTRRAGS